MPAFAVFPPSGTRDFRLRCIDSHNFDFESMKKKIQFAAGDFSASRLQDDGGFQGISGRQQARPVFTDLGEKGLPFGLGKENSDKRRSIDDHQRGIP